MDMEGNIYDLKGNFIGTTDGDGEGAMGGNSQLMGGEEEQYEVEEYWIWNECVTQLEIYSLII